MKTVIQPETGRLIGLYPSGSAENFLWENPAPRATGWCNVGGDRTWLAPEIELFIGDLTRPIETYRVPAELDPGGWRRNGAATHLVNETRLRLLRAGRDAGVRLSKTYGDAANPLPASGLAFAGYTQETTLETDARLGIWNLLQLPPGGEMLIATRGTARPHVVFGTLAADELSVEPGLVRWRMARSGPDAKIAIKAAEVTGRAGYLRPSATPGQMDLIVREFDVDPAGDYVDALWEAPHEAGWAFQACCVRNGTERFNELEYHAPAGCRRDESRVWAFRGPVEAVRAAAKELLLSDNPMLKGTGLWPA